MSVDWEQVEQENRLWPWLADDSMADREPGDDFEAGIWDDEPREDVDPEEDGGAK